ncbi:hypothetical protein Acid345_3910 [Candidatus Koribacter versatilis Ellin345]|uniref:Uncharacterized protein n=1 Tax=Koribacter versatilis (strain Ellin345) TaxID=204669 RepID=Q1IJP0_KORVE|nr:hypothetical protein [Candidatus Koribacter versatilis]ABF42910.1 hypothetical protein Acid345_3910 [Candidatus Koribacter versatilis Ellin345]
METYGILNNRKRAIIALVHSFVFLGIAMIRLASAPKAGLLLPQRAFTAGNIAVFCVYFIVTSVLLILTGYSRCLRERAYFAFCSASASVGLLRAVVGDPVSHVGPIARVLLLGTAVVIGFAILSAHSQTATPAET